MARQICSMPSPEVLAAVPGDEDHAALPPSRRPPERPSSSSMPSAHGGVAGLGGHLDAQGVDDGVAGHRNRLLRDGLAQQRRPGPLPSVRNGVPPTASPAGGSPPRERATRCCRCAARPRRGRWGCADRSRPTPPQHGGGVTLHQRHVRLGRSQPAVDAVHEPGRQARQSLVGTHHVEIGVDREAEDLGDLAEHLLVLAGGHHRAAEVVGIAQRRHHRGQLNRLRAGAHEDRDVARRTHGLTRVASCRRVRSRPRRRATISRPASQINSLLVVR